MLGFTGLFHQVFNAGISAFDSPTADASFATEVDSHFLFREDQITGANVDPFESYLIDGEAEGSLEDNAVDVSTGLKGLAQTGFGDSMHATVAIMDQGTTLNLLYAVVPLGSEVFIDVIVAGGNDESQKATQFTIETPEPSTAIVLILGALGMASRRRKV